MLWATGTWGGDWRYRRQDLESVKNTKEKLLKIVKQNHPTAQAQSQGSTRISSIH